AVPVGEPRLGSTLPELPLPRLLAAGPQLVIVGKFETEDRAFGRQLQAALLAGRREVSAVSGQELGHQPSVLEAVLVVQELFERRRELDVDVQVSVLLMPDGSDCPCRPLAGAHDDKTRRVVDALEGPGERGAVRSALAGDACGRTVGDERDGGESD